MSEATDLAIRQVEIQWNIAPPHIKVMAKSYVVPLLNALRALNAELAEQWIFMEELAANNNRIVEAMFAASSDAADITDEKYHSDRKI